MTTAASSSNTVDVLNTGVCPDCGGKLFRRGPSAGLSINVKCANLECGSKFCVSPPFTPDRIANEDFLYHLSARELFEII